MTSAEQLWAVFLEERPSVAGPGDAYTAWHFWARAETTTGPAEGRTLRRARPA